MHPGADGVEFVSAAALSAVPTDRLHVIYGLAKVSASWPTRRCAACCPCYPCSGGLVGRVGRVSAWFAGVLRLSPNKGSCCLTQLVVKGDDD